MPQLVEATLEVATEMRMAEEASAQRAAVLMVEAEMRRRAEEEEEKARRDVVELEAAILELVAASRQQRGHMRSVLRLSSANRAMDPFAFETHHPSSTAERQAPAPRTPPSMFARWPC